MGTTRTKVEVFETNYICDKCGEGKMIANGVALLSHPPHYEHICNKCGAIKNFFAQKFPHHEYVPVANPKPLPPPSRTIREHTTKEIPPEPRIEVRNFPGQPILVVAIFRDSEGRRVTQFVGEFNSTDRDNIMDACIAGEALAKAYGYTFRQDVVRLKP